MKKTLTLIKKEKPILTLTKKPELVIPKDKNPKSFAILKALKKLI